MRHCTGHWEYGGDWPYFFCFSNRIMCGYFIILLQKSLCWIHFSMDSRHLQSEDFDVYHQILTIQHINIILLLELEAYLEQKL